MKFPSTKKQSKSTGRFKGCHVIISESYVEPKNNDSDINSAATRVCKEFGFSMRKPMKPGPHL